MYRFSSQNVRMLVKSRPPHKGFPSSPLEKCPNRAQFQGLLLEPRAHTKNFLLYTVHTALSSRPNFPPIFSVVSYVHCKWKGGGPAASSSFSQSCASSCAALGRSSGFLANGCKRAGTCFEGLKSQFLWWHSFVRHEVMAAQNLLAEGFHHSRALHDNASKKFILTIQCVNWSPSFVLIKTDSKIQNIWKPSVWLLRITMNRESFTRSKLRGRSPAMTFL